MRASPLLVLLAVSMAAAGPAAAQLYRWTDAQGRTHFTDAPPPPGARNVQKRDARAAGAAEAAPTPGEPFLLQQARKNHPVTLYSTPGCGAACGEARRLLNARGIPFKEVSVDSEADIASLQAAVGSNSVPSMLVGRQVLKGFEEGSYHAALDLAGYPKAGILPPRSQSEPTRPAPEQPKAIPVAPPPPPGPYSPDARR